MSRLILVLACGLAAFAPSGCKIVKAAPPSAQAADPDAAKIAGIVAETYDAKLVPLITLQGTPADKLVPAILNNLDAAGQSHGHKGEGAGASWVFAIQGKGVVVAENRQSRAATVDLDVTGDGKADLSVQLGPVVKGTALRDVAPFYDFTSFRDQIQFAKLGRALNDHAVGTLKVPAGDLIGKTVVFAGAFAIHAPEDPILVAPVQLEVRP